MPEIEFSKSFVQYLADLPEQTRKKVYKTLRLLAENPRHPSLQSKPIQGAPGIYEARVDRFWRLSYERLPGDVLRLRVVGRHDETIRNP